MKNILRKLIYTQPLGNSFDSGMLIFRILLSVELIYAHGLKKIGIGVGEAEIVPNPLGLPDVFNSLFADAANLIFPLFVIMGLMTRLAVLPILAVTLTGYFVLHFHDAPLIKDTPYMYSLSYLLILFFGAGKYSLDYLIERKMVTK